MGHYLSILCDPRKDPNFEEPEGDKPHPSEKAQKSLKSAISVFNVEFEEEEKGKEEMLFFHKKEKTASDLTKKFQKTRRLTPSKDPFDAERSKKLISYGDDLVKSIQILDKKAKFKDQEVKNQLLKTFFDDKRFTDIATLTNPDFARFNVSELSKQAFSCALYQLHSL